MRVSHILSIHLRWILLLVCATTHPGWAHLVTLPYFNDFSEDADDFFAPSHNGYNWGYDWRTHNYQTWVTVGNRAVSATIEARALGGDPASATDFKLACTVDPLAIVGSNTIGFGALGSDDDFSGGATSGYYLADVRTLENRIRIVRVQSGNIFIGPERDIVGLDLRDLEPFELELIGTYAGGALNLAFTVRRGAASDTLNATDNAVLTGQTFGLRSRTASGTSSLEVHFDDVLLRPLHLVNSESTPPPFAQVGLPFSFTPVALADPAAAVNVTGINLPAWLQVNAGTLSGTPGPGDVGLPRITLHFDSGVAQTDQTFDLSVIHPAGPMISEFMAENQGSLLDEDGNSPDWIELFNPGTSTVQLAGWHLSDDPLVPQKWMIPSETTLAPLGFTVIFASGKTNATHANFRLNNRAGEYLALAHPDGSPASVIASHPKQRADISYGAFGDYTTTGYLLEPTPGAANVSTGFIDFVEDTRFSLDRGFYEGSQVVTVRCDTVGATLVTTTDGSTPSLVNGSTHVAGVTNAPQVVLNLTQTTVLRARAFKPSWMPSNTDTQSYLFLVDILTQQANGSAPLGWPSGSVNGQAFDYGMDPDVTSQFSAAELAAAMTNLPTWSLVTDLSKLTDPATGIYVNAEYRGIDWERTVSMEWIEANQQPGFQIDGSLRIRGGASRVASNPKHSFHLYFRDQALNFPLFGSEGVDAFKRIDLRTTQGTSWHRTGSNSTIFNRDVFGRDTQRDMGAPYTRSRYHHLMINGIYFGLFQTQERLDRFYGASYFGRDNAEYDVFKTRTKSHRVEALDGDEIAWTALYDAAVAGFASDAEYFAVQGRDVNGAIDPGVSNLVDVVNLIDYMLVIFHTGSTDGPVSLGANVPKNFYALRPRDGRFGFRFFIHDNEDTLNTLNRDGTVSNNTGSRITHFNPKWLHQQLMGNARYRRLFGDRTHRHLYNQGALSPSANTARFFARAGEISEAVIGESARWGDAVTASPRLPSHWQSAINAVVSGYMPTRGNILVGQLRSRGLYPNVDAPTFSQHGGQVSNGVNIGVSASAGTIYFTEDGQSDPADPGAAVFSGGIPITLPLTTLRARVLDGGEWSALTEAIFVTARPARSNDLVITEFHYNPTGPDDAEFIELLNVSTGRLDLADCTLADAVTYRFGTIVLEAGERILVVEDLVAFTNRYGTSLSIAGQWAGGLGNTSDRIALLDRDRQLIEAVTYTQDLPWPPQADGDGYSLVRISATEPANDPASWRSSASIGGVPGANDTSSYSTWLGNHPGGSLDAYLFNAPKGLTPEQTEAGWAVRYPRRIAADDYRFRHQVSIDGLHWIDGGTIIAIENRTDGLQEVTVQLPETNARIWVRVRAEPR
ncbi:MAG: hypothetical protein ACI9TH_000483 [Kiritimatiellia bacterium]|jgi:hypothetical protein